MYIIRHSERLDFTDEKKWLSTDRFKTNNSDPPLGQNGVKIANEKITKLLLNINVDDLGLIYSSPLTRCIETSLAFQKAIKDKYNILIPIKIEYGLCFEFSNQENIYLSTSKFIIKNNKLEYIQNSSKLIDKYIEQKNIYSRYGKEKFDTKYKSIVSIDDINNQESLIESINEKFNVILKISKKIDFTKFNVLCTHAENISFYKSFIEKKWNMYDNQFSGNCNYCSYIKINKNNNKLIIEDVNTIK